MRARLTKITLLLALALIVPTLCLGSMGAAKMLKPGATAPDFKFKDITGAEDSLYGFSKDKPSLLVFIQTACGSCQREMQYLKELKAKTPELNLLAVFIDVKEMDFKKYVADNALPFRFTWDANYSVADAYGVSFAPASFLMDKEHKVAKVYRGWSKAGEELAQDYGTLTSQ